MSKIEKLIFALLSGTSDSNISFWELKTVLEYFGFECVRVRGSHHIYVKEGVDEIINIQPKGSKAKPYQVKQVRNLLFKYSK